MQGGERKCSIVYSHKIDLIEMKEMAPVENRGGCGGSACVCRARSCSIEMEKG